MQNQNQSIADRWEFLIKVNPHYYLAAIERGQVTGTAILSQAAHFDYKSADKICAGLRVHGYSSATVTTILGEPVTEAVLRGESPAPSDDLPKSAADVDRIPAHEFKKRMLTDPKFRSRVDEIEAQGVR
jgi:hypothetical protein